MNKKNEEYIRKSLIMYWKNLNTSLQKERDTADWDYECAYNLDRLEAGKPLDSADYEDYEWFSREANDKI